MKDTARKREGQQLLLRFAEGSDLRDRLDEIARANARSLTAEILFRLEASIAEHSEERSRLAARRILASNLTEYESPGEERLAALEKRISRLEASAAKRGGKPK